MSRNVLVLKHIEKDKKIPSDIDIHKAIADFEKDMLYRDRASSESQTKPLYFESLVILINGEKITSRIFEYKITGTYRFFYVSYTINGVQYFVLTDADWEHKQNAHPLAYSPEHRQKIAEMVSDEIMRDQEKNANPPVAAVTSLSRPVVQYRGKVHTLTQTQEEAHYLSLGHNVIVSAFAGAGKTLLAVKWICAQLADKKHPLYFTLSFPLLQDLQKEFSGEKGSLELTTWDFFIRYLNENGFRIEVPDRLNTAVGYPYFREWKKNNNVAQWDDETLYAEFIYTILRPGASLDSPYLSRDEYNELGVHESYFDKEERDKVYTAFLSYLNSIPGNSHEPHLLMHAYFIAIKKRISELTDKDKNRLLNVLFNAICIDEMQQLHPWQVACILLLAKFTGSKIYCCLDPNQAIDDQRLSVMNIIVGLFSDFGIEYKVIFLKNNLRNDLMIAAFAKVCMLVKQNLHGLMSRNDYIPFDLCFESSLGNVSITHFDPHNPEKIPVTPKTMCLVPSLNEIDFCRNSFGISSVIPFSASAGREWSEVVIVLSMQHRNNIADIFSFFEHCIGRIEFSVPNAHGANRKIRPDLKIQRFLNQLIMLSTRGCHSVRILIDDPQLADFFNHVLSALQAKVNEIRTQREIRAIREDDEKKSNLVFYPIDWVTEAKKNLADQNSDIRAAGLATLWSMEVWLTLERVESAKQLYEVVKKTIPEIDFVQAFAEKLSAFVAQQIDPTAIEQWYQTVCNKIASPAFEPSVESLSAILSEEFDKKFAHDNRKASAVNNNNASSAASSGLFAKELPMEDVNTLIIGVKTALRRPGDLAPWRQKIQVRLESQRNDRQSLENKVELYLLLIEIDFENNAVKDDVLNKCADLINSISHDKQMYYREKLIFLAFLCDKMELPTIQNLIPIPKKSQSNANPLISLCVLLKKFQKETRFDKLKEYAALLSQQFYNYLQKLNNLASAGIDLTLKIARVEIGLTLVANAIRYYSQKEIVKLKMKESNREKFYADFKKYEQTFLDFWNSLKNFVADHFKMKTDERVPIRDVSMHPERVTFLLDFVIPLKKEVNDASLSYLIELSSQLLEKGASDSKKQLLGMAIKKLCFDDFVSFEDMPVFLSYKKFLYQLMLSSFLALYFLINSYHINVDKLNINVDKLPVLLFLLALAFPGGFALFAIFHIIKCKLYPRAEDSNIQKLFEQTVERIYLTVDPLTDIGPKETPSPSRPARTPM